MAQRDAAKHRSAQAALEARKREAGQVHFRRWLPKDEAAWADAELGARKKGEGTEAALRQELADLKKEIEDLEAEIEDPKRKAGARRKRIVTAAATFAATAVAMAMIQPGAFGFQPFSPAHWSALAAHGLGGLQHGLPLALSFIGAWWAWRVANALVCDKLLRVPLHEGGQAYWLAAHAVVPAGGLLAAWAAWTPF